MIIPQVLFNPQNDRVFLLVGDGVFRIVRFKTILIWGEWEVRFKTIGFYQAKSMPITTAMWYDSEKVLAGTSDGRLLVVENGELKGIYNLNSMIELVIPERQS